MTSFDNSISFRKASYVAGMAVGIGCLGPVSAVGYIGAAVAGAFGAIAIDGMRSIIKASISPFYAKFSHKVAHSLDLEKKVDVLMEVFLMIESHPVYLHLIEKKYFKKALSSEEFLCLFKSKQNRRGEGEITELLHSTAGALCSTDQLRAIDVKRVFYFEMLHKLLLTITSIKANLLMEDLKILQPLSETESPEKTSARKDEIERLEQLSHQLQSELYPFKIVDGEIFNARSLGSNYQSSFKALADLCPQSKIYSGRITFLTRTEFETDFLYYTTVLAPKVIKTHFPKYNEERDRVKLLPLLPKFRESKSAFTGRTLFFQYSQNKYCFYDPQEGFFSFDKEEDFFSALSLERAEYAHAQFSFYFSNQE